MDTFSTLEEAYENFAYKHGTVDMPLSAEEWGEAMSFLNVSQLDARLLWTELDDDSSGLIDFSTFENKMLDVLEEESADEEEGGELGSPVLDEEDDDESDDDDWTRYVAIHSKGLGGDSGRITVSNMLGDSLQDSVTG